MSDKKIWIRHRGNKYVIVRIANGKQEQIADFPNKTLAKDYVKKRHIAEQLKKVVDKEYDFKSKFEEYANIKLEGGSDDNTCLTKSGGSRYLSHYNNYIKPHFPDCKVHEVTSEQLQKFVDNHLGKAGKTDPTKYKNTCRILDNIKRFLKWCVVKNYHNHFQSAMLYKIPTEQVPSDLSLAKPKKATVITPAEAKRLLAFVWEHRDQNIHTAYACIIFHVLFYFGFRRSELLGLRKTDINLNNNYFNVQGMFDVEDNIYRNKTKNEGSKRKVYFDPTGDAKKKIAWMLDWSNRTYPGSDYLVAATRGKSPLSAFMYRKIIYTTYEALGFAKVAWSSDSFRVEECKFKGCISKTFRHLKATQLIQAKNILQLSENYIKRVMGHDLYTTTSQIYGDHDILDNKEHLETARKIEHHRKIN